MPIVSIASVNTEIASMNLETPRVQELIPREVRARGNNFVSLLEEYYRYMNSSSQPTELLNSLLDEHDLDLTTETFINNIQAEIASYVPAAYSIDKATLYKRIVKYFYNTRGTVESAETFFRIFYDTGAEIQSLHELGEDGNNPLADDILADDGEVNAEQKRQEWLPYSYLIKTQLPLAIWQKAYKELIHPAGFRFFALLLFVSITQNDWGYPSFEQPGTEFDYENSNLIWFIKPPIGSHTPHHQPGWIGNRIRRVFFALFADSVTNEEDRLVFLRIKMAFMQLDGQLSINRKDHISWTKWYDSTPIGHYQNYTFAEMDDINHNIYESAKFIALGSFIQLS